MTDAFTDEQLRNWAENVTEPTVRDLARALLAKTAECEALRESGEYQYLLVRIAGLEADLARERQRVEAAEAQLTEAREALRAIEWRCVLSASLIAEKGD